ncbi:DJ-1/PfpI family protein [Actinorugispora endophytica]|uniref:Putative intracellular protease/amidase n=1 Tax=Actinorugispora endophytica TaxID=1605990 RepID=A0A4R6UJ13_9ACTN|nr:DJ-1/PfpI family protein [Actinorugispora endophytica]TDQ46898.1 putative intracellular protease/amidase [Actinorugispora endophytica]
MADLVRAADGRLAGRRIAILIESDYYEPEIFYYQRRFAEEGAEVVFLTRMWGRAELTFTGHEYRAPFTCTGSVEDVDDAELASFAALLIPSGMVSDRLRYTEDVTAIAPATDLVRRAFAEPGVLKGVICHGLWLVAPIPEVVRGRRVTAHNNLIGDVRNMGADYVDADVVVDGDLVTGRSGQHAHLFARRVIELLDRPAPGPRWSHAALNCRSPRATEEFYTRWFGFRRARAVPLGDGAEIVFLRSGDAYLELFGSPGGGAPGTGDGPDLPGTVRHLAFQTDDVDGLLKRMGDGARVTLGPLDFDAFIPGWRSVWLTDPDGVVVEVSQGYQDADPAADAAAEGGRR